MVWVWVFVCVGGGVCVCLCLCVCVCVCGTSRGLTFVPTHPRSSSTLNTTALRRRPLPPRLRSTKSSRMSREPCSYCAPFGDPSSGVKGPGRPGERWGGEVGLPWYLWWGHLCESHWAPVVWVTSTHNVLLVLELCYGGSFGDFADHFRGHLLRLRQPYTDPRAKVRARSTVCGL